LIGPFGGRQARIERHKDQTGGGYGVGQVDLPEGVRVQTLIDGRPADFEIGLRMRLEANVVATDEDGTEYCGFKFVPVLVAERGSA